MNKINGIGWISFLTILSVVSVILLWSKEKQPDLQINLPAVQQTSVPEPVSRTAPVAEKQQKAGFPAELTEVIHNDSLPLAERYHACKTFRQQLLNFLHAGAKPDADFHDHLLLVCRKVSNQQLVSEERLVQWQLLKGMVREQGPDVLLSMLRSGELSPDFAIQQTSPKMNLLFLIGTTVTDADVYRQLINMGVEVNSLFLDAVLINGDLELVKLYAEYAGLSETDDMLVRPFYQAARVGNVEAMIWLAEQGALLSDPLGRDPLLALFHRAPQELTAQSLLRLLATTGQQLNATHVAAVRQQKGRISEEVKLLVESLVR